MKESQPISIGRFRFAMPTVLTVTGRKQSIYRVEVVTDTSTPAEADRLWKERIQQIRGVKMPRGMDTILKTFELKPGVQAVWYRRNPDLPHLLNLEATQYHANHRIVLSRGCEAGKEATVEKLVGNVAKAYQPDISRGFCVGHGCIISEPGQNEDVRVMFHHQRWPEIEGAFETHTVATPMINRRAEDAKKSAVEVAAKGGRITVRQNEPRNVAGLNGQLTVIESSLSGEAPMVYYSWDFAGVPGNSYTPAVELALRGPRDHNEQIQAAFNVMLESLSLLPPAK